MKLSYNLILTKPSLSSAMDWKFELSVFGQGLFFKKNYILTLSSCSKIGHFRRRNVNLVLISCFDIGHHTDFFTPQLRFSVAFFRNFHKPRLLNLYRSAICNMIPLHDETASLTPAYDEDMMRSAENTTSRESQDSLDQLSGSTAPVPSSVSPFQKCVTSPSRSLNQEEALWTSVKTNVRKSDLV